MEIADFTFQSRQVVPTVIETVLTAKNGNKFGIHYRAIQPAPDNFVFEWFKQNKQAFFVEVDSLVKQTRKRIKPSQKLLTAGS